MFIFNAATAVLILLSIASSLILSRPIQLPPPIVTITPLPGGPLYLGSHVDLLCTISTDAEIDIPVMVNALWSGPQGPIYNGNMNAILQPNVTYNITLQIKPFNSNDTGVYQCTAIIFLILNPGVASRASANILLSVQALPPPVVTTSSYGNSIAGSVYSLVCTVKVVEGLVVVPDVMWMKGGRVVVNGTNTTLIKAVSGGNSTLILIFTPLLTSQGGQYFCISSVNSSEFSFHTTASMFVSVHIITILAFGEPIAGQTYQLSCTSTVYGSTLLIPEVLWRNLAGVTPTGNNVLANGSNLTFTGLQAYNEGSYVCLSSVKILNSTATLWTNVSVQTAPYVPQGVTVTAVNATFMRVSWYSTAGNATHGLIVAFEVMQVGPLNTRYSYVPGNVTSLLIGLEPCAVYNVLVRAYTSRGPGPYSAPAQDASANAGQVPQPPEVLQSDLTATSANLTWSCPLLLNRTVISYTVKIVLVNTTSINAQCIRGRNRTMYFDSIPSYQTHLELDGVLLPYMWYEFSVLAKTGAVRGDLYSATRLFRTHEAPPSSINLNLLALNHTSLLLRWTQPNCTNGVLAGYLIMYSAISPTFIAVPSTLNAFVINGLSSNTMYSVSVCALTTAGCGVAGNGTVFTLHALTAQPMVFYLRMSSAIDASSSMLAQLENKLNNLGRGMTAEGAFNASCTYVDKLRHGCQVDHNNGLNRIECIFYLHLNANDTAKVIHSVINNAIRSENSTSNIIASDRGFCSCDVSNNGRGIYSWPEVQANEAVSYPCQYGPWDFKVTRICMVDGRWQEDSTNCTTAVTNRFNMLKNTNLMVVKGNVLNITAQLQSTVSQATTELDMTTANLAIVTSLFTQISNLSSVTNGTVQKEVVIASLGILDTIQYWPAQVLATESSKIVKLFETTVQNVVQQENFTSLTVTQNQSIFNAEKISRSNLTTKGTSFSFFGRRDGLSDVSPSPASIVLPASLFKGVTENSSSVGIFFFIYKTSALFQLLNATNTSIISSLVIGATVVSSAPIINLTDPVEIEFHITIQNYSALHCVWWDFEAGGRRGVGNWSTSGCQLRYSTANQTKCVCTHLTNFAILVDISIRTAATPNMPTKVEKTVERAIEYISYIGVVLSLAGLVLTIISLSCFKKLRSKDTSKFHLQLCSALIGMLLVFVLGIDKTENFEICVIVSVLIHYFTLVAVMWMGAEALLMFQKFVVVFVRIKNRYTIILSLICWATPLVPVAVPLSFDRNFLVNRNTTHGYCFISDVRVFFGAFLGPILLIMVFNFTVFITVMVILVRHLLRRTKDSNKKGTPLKMLSSVASISALFGLTWVFGALTVSKADLAFQVIFAVSNSFQGFLIFVFFCALNKEVQLAWKQLFCQAHHEKSDTRTSKQTTHTTASETMDPNPKHIDFQMRRTGTNIHHSGTAYTLD